MKEFVNRLADHASVMIGILILLVSLVLLIIITTKFVGKRLKTKKQRLWKESLYQTLTDSVFQIYILVRKEDLLPVFVSDNIQKLLGLDKKDVEVDLSALGWIVDEEDKERIRTMWQSWDKTEPFMIDCKGIHYITGEKVYFLLHISEDQAGEYYIILLQDIKKQKEAEFALKEKLAKAEKENQAKTEFLSKMSHEIRTPMNGILGMLELAKMDLDRRDKVEECLDKANGLSQFLLSLINDILDLTRIESGKTELLCEPFDLYGLADKLRSMFQENMMEKGIQFRMDMEDFDVHWVMGDEMRLSQVVVNFLSNAVKFTDYGGKITVTFRQMQIINNSMRLMIRVRDTGKGIEPEFLSDIFKPFEQEDNKIARKYGGSGLGMTISDNIIRLMGGQITIDSEVGKGSDFTVFLCLPIAKEVEAVDETEKKSQEELSEDNWDAYLSGAHVLLAEDNDINARIAIKVLEKDGMSVERAVNGNEAVRTFEERPEGYFSVVLMDIQMPELNGWDATKKIRSLERTDAKNIPIYALSANAFVEDKRHSTEVGMNGHISKPIDFKELRRIIGMAIRDRNI